MYTNISKQGTYRITVKLYQEKRRKIDFPDYSNFKDINDAYSDFTEKVTSVIDEIAPLKETLVK